MKTFEALRKKTGSLLFTHLIKPPEDKSPKITPFQGDYGHGFHYEQLFSGDGTDIDFAVQICKENPGPILDLGGGAGRLSVELSCRGYSVMLVDRSFCMLERARKQRQLLSKSAKTLFKISPQDISCMELDSEYQNIFSLNNLLEHFLSDNLLLSALRNINRHLKKTGHFYLDVHFPLYFSKDPLWKKGSWRYTNDTRIDKKRFRIWSRTFTKETLPEVICEHAISENLTNYKLLSTKLRIRSSEEWVSFFEMTGFHVCETWGNWKKDAVSPALPKLVFKLVKG